MSDGCNEQIFQRRCDRPVVRDGKCEEHKVERRKNLRSDRDEAAMEANTRYAMYEIVTLGTSEPLSWAQVQKKHQHGVVDVDSNGEPQVNWGAARDEYNEQPRLKALRANKETMWFEMDEFLCTREEYVQRHRDSALTLFAVVKDGVWYERGSMGWWGMVSNEQDRNEWNAKFSALIDDLPENTLLTVVDCHI